ncbi:histidine kinase [Paenibacillus qinlingensis]|uniref:Two-component system sensor histidine kinase YesM n=1 Tax=Paenibacillus qinlingensis TaxID=1837343 RepID=A0ABU1NU16_9BACL|nr:histidine kinase [Paenibacillus qinlingensis]MDR6550975.1 two-component system sensor histidine kinase YesM [Paenibacillus qinlingensis]
MRIKTMTIKLKLVLLFFGFFCVPFLVLGKFWYDRSMKTIEDNAINNSQQLMRQMNYNLDVYFSDIKKATLPLLAHPLVQQFVKIDPKNQYDYYDLSSHIRSDLIPNTVYNRDDIYGLSIISLKGPYYSNIAFSDRVDLYRKEFSENAKDNFRILGINTTGDGTEVITIFRRIIDNETYITAGYLIIDLSLNRTTNISNQAQLGKTGIISIVNSDNRYLYHPEPQKWQQPVQEQFKNRFENINLPYFTNGSGAGKTIVVFNRSTSTGLTIVSEVPLRELMEDLIYFRNLTLGVVLLLIVLAFLTIISFSLSITRALSHLMNLMKKVEMGDLSIRAPLRKDEIGSLNRGFNLMLEDLNRLIDMIHISHLKEKEMAVYQKESKIQMLQARINPHFLYNTLGVINAYAIIAKVKPISQMTVWLSDIFRYSIDNPVDTVSLSEEIQHMFNYIYIQKERYQSLEVDVNLNFELLKDIHTLRLTVQPIVENSFIHGYENYSIKPEYIGLRASFDEDGVKLWIIDKGRGMPSDLVQTYNDAFACMSEEQMLLKSAPFGGIGMWNVHSRLRLEFGKPYGLSIVKSESNGTIVEIKMPYRKE